MSTLNWSEGFSLGFEKRGDKIVISPVRPRYKLDDLLEGITKKNAPKLVFSDNKSRGKEIW